MRSLPSVRCWLFALVVSAISAASFAQVSIAIRIGPPALPVYELGGSGAHTHCTRLAIANQARPLDVRSAS
jgi:hypothetical protein